MKKYKIFLVLMIFLLSLCLAHAKTDVIEEGETKTYNIDGRSIEVDNIIVTDSGLIYTQFKVDGEVTLKLREGRSDTVADGVKITIIQILPNEMGDVTADLVEFTIELEEEIFTPAISTPSGSSSSSSPSTQQDDEDEEVIIKDLISDESLARNASVGVCGDGKCSKGEFCEKDGCCDGKKTDLDFDNNNCGYCGKACQEDFPSCNLGFCVEERCGDGMCYIGEYCEKDGCCGANQINILTNNLNCGYCGVACGDFYTCVDGECVSICGDGICAPDESCKTCVEDCACDDSERCHNGVCVEMVCGDYVCDVIEDCSNCEHDCGCKEGNECVSGECMGYECLTAEDCDDDNACTTDVCSGAPKRCTNEQTNEGCNHKGECLPMGSRTEDQYCSGITMKSLKPDAEPCLYDHECSIESCVNEVCKLPNMFQKVSLWFKGLFK